MEGYSPEGSSSCNRCPTNTIQSSDGCLTCQDNEIGYPGDKQCRKKPDCIAEYDAEPMYGECIQNKRSVTYKWRSDSICNKRIAKLPAPEQVECHICHPGYFSKGELNPQCEACPNGFYTNDVNMKDCLDCPAGKYAPRVVRYENLEKMPAQFSTKCESMQNEQVDLCAFSKGWIVAKSAFTSYPNLLPGARIILSITSNITEEYGLLEFTYQVFNGTANETLQIMIDNIKYSKLIDNF